MLQNSQTYEWLPVKTSVPQDSILGPLSFLIDIKDLSDHLLLTVKLFAGDTSLFSVVNDGAGLNKDLQNVTEWAYKWKMSFNLDLNKQAQEMIFIF